MPYDLFWQLNPARLKPFEKAYENEQKIADERAWNIGRYVCLSVLWGIDHGFNGSKASVEYPDKPYSQQEVKTEENMTDEEMTRNHEALFTYLGVLKANFELENPEKKHHPPESEVVTHG